MNESPSSVVYVNINNKLDENLNIEENFDDSIKQNINFSFPNSFYSLNIPSSFYYKDPYNDNIFYFAKNIDNYCSIIKIENNQSIWENSSILQGNCINMVSLNDLLFVVLDDGSISILDTETSLVAMPSMLFESSILRIKAYPEYLENLLLILTVDLNFYIYKIENKHDIIKLFHQKLSFCLSPLDMENIQIGRTYLLNDCSITGFLYINDYDVFDNNLYNIIRMKKSKSQMQFSNENFFLSPFENDKKSKIYYSRKSNTWQFMQNPDEDISSQFLIESQINLIETLEELNAFFEYQIISYDTKFLESYCRIIDFHLTNNTFYSDICILEHFRRLFSIISYKPTNFFNSLFNSNICGISYQTIFNKMIELVGDKKPRLINYISDSLDLSKINGESSSSKKSIAQIINNKIEENRLKQLYIDKQYIDICTAKRNKEQFIEYINKAQELLNLANDNLIKAQTFSDIHFDKNSDINYNKFLEPIIKIPLYQPIDKLEMKHFPTMNGIPTNPQNFKVQNISVKLPLLQDHETTNTSNNQLEHMIANQDSTSQDVSDNDIISFKNLLKENTSTPKSPSRLQQDIQKVFSQSFNKTSEKTTEETNSDIEILTIQPTAEASDSAASNIFSSDNITFNKLELNKNKIQNKTEKQIPNQTNETKISLPSPPPVPLEPKVTTQNIQKSLPIKVGTLNLNISRHNSASLNDSKNMNASKEQSSEMSNKELTIQETLKETTKTQEKPKSKPIRIERKTLSSSFSYNSYSLDDSTSSSYDKEEDDDKNDTDFSLNENDDDDDDLDIGQDYSSRKRNRKPKNLNTNKTIPTNLNANKNIPANQIKSTPIQNTVNHSLQDFKFFSTSVLLSSDDYIYHLLCLVQGVQHLKSLLHDESQPIVQRCFLYQGIQRTAQAHYLDFQSISNYLDPGRSLSTISSFVINAYMNQQQNLPNRK